MKASATSTECRSGQTGQGSKTGQTRPPGPPPKWSQIDRDAPWHSFRRENPDHHRRVDLFMAGKGLVTRWERIRQQNHWLDALYNACAAGHLSGARLLDAPPEPPLPRRKYGVLSDFASAHTGYDTQRWREMTDRWRS